MSPTTSYRTGLGSSDADSITLLGHSLADDLLGKVTFGELAFWLIAKRRPTAPAAQHVRGRASRPGRSRLHPHRHLGEGDAAERAGVDSGSAGRGACSERRPVPG